MRIRGKGEKNERKLRWEITEGCWNLDKKKYRENPGTGEDNRTFYRSSIRYYQFLPHSCPFSFSSQDERAPIYNRFLRQKSNFLKFFLFPTFFFPFSSRNLKFIHLLFSKPGKIIYREDDKILELILNHEF